MPLEEIKRRFIDEIKLRAYDDEYIDRNEEREILQIAIQQGISVDSARLSLAHVCEHLGYVLESAVITTIKEEVQTAISNDGQMDENEFAGVFENAKRRMRGKKNDREIKKMIVTLMEDLSLNQVKTGWFNSWYTSMKKELGMA